MDPIHDEVARLVRQRAEREEAYARDLILDVLAGYAKIHDQISGHPCADPFGDAPCRFDDTLVLTVASLGRQ